MKNYVSRLRKWHDEVHYFNENMIEQISHILIEGGDNKYCSIAAASIIAKTTRDRIMNSIDKIYPNYGFTEHKGYGTRKHLNLLREFGPTPFHRKSFGPVKDLSRF